MLFSVSFLTLSILWHLSFLYLIVSGPVLFGCLLSLSELLWLFHPLLLTLFLFILVQLSSDSHSFLLKPSVLTFFLSYFSTISLVSRMSGMGPNHAWVRGR